MRAICMVAHPDDCVIFALGYIVAHPEYDWRICYLTYRSNTPRGKEITDFWARRNIAVEFLGFTDNKRDIILNTLSFNPIMARNFISTEIESSDVVLTHSEQGDYGHVHHKFVHDCCRSHTGLVTFAKEGIEYSVPSDYYTLDELPIHAKAIRRFVDPINQVNFYSKL